MNTVPVMVLVSFSLNGALFSQINMSAYNQMPSRDNHDGNDDQNTVISNIQQDRGDFEVCYDPKLCKYYISFCFTSW